MANLSDPISTDPSTDMPTAPSGYLVRHNTLIVGIFDNEFDANDALNGYQMQNDIQLDDTLDVLQIL